MGTVTEQHRAVAMHAIKIMGGEGRPRVQAFHDDHCQRSVDILTTFSSPEAGLKSIASIGLSDFVLRRAGGTNWKRASSCVRVQNRTRCIGTTSSPRRPLQSCAIVQRCDLEV